MTKKIVITGGLGYIGTELCKIYSGISWNNEILVIAQLETKTSFNNLDEILNVDGIDAYAWGSNDLAQSMGFPGEPDHVEVKDAESRVANKIHSLGKSMLFDFSEMDDLGKIILKGLKDFAKKD